MTGDMEVDRPTRVLVADDEGSVRRSMVRLLEAQGYEVVEAEDGSRAWDMVQEERPDIVVSDILMPGLDGLELCRAIRDDPELRLTPVVLVTGLGDTEDRIRGIDAGADDFITKPFDIHELVARVRSLARMKRYTDELERAEAVLFALARAIEGRDPHTEGHCERLSELGSRLGRRLGLSEEEVTALDRGGVVHDVGKVAVPDRVLLKPGRLTEEEWAYMRLHPAEGERICADLKAFQPVLPIIRHHHERGDGSGYPDGLSAQEIPTVARVLQVVDVYDALTSTRPYKSSMSSEKALGILKEEAERGWWDSGVVAEFEEMIRAWGNGNGRPPARQPPG